jgi:hydrogenase nickel incorporation protein HypA/HybF
VLEVGRLSAVAPDSIRFCFEIAARGTPLEDAALEIIETPGMAECRRCGAAVPLEDLLGTCGCGSIDLEIVGGQQLLIKTVEVA